MPNSRVFCRNCGNPLTDEESTKIREACPICHSKSRVFEEYIQEEVKLSDHFVEVHKRDDKAIGFGESSDPHMVRSAKIMDNGDIIVDLSGISPQNEQDSTNVVLIFRDYLREKGNIILDRLEQGQADDDFVLFYQNQQFGIQVVRALTDKKFWKNLALTGRIPQIRLSLVDANKALKAAIEHKTKIPLLQRSRMILVLDAYRIPGLGLSSVVEEFRSVFGNWTRSLGFKAVFIVGPDVDFVARLDKEIADLN
jgi:hypothetical protein